MKISTKEGEGREEKSEGGEGVRGGGGGGGAREDWLGLAREEPYVRTYRTYVTYVRTKARVEEIYSKLGT